MSSFIPDGKWKGTKRRNHCLLPSRGCQLSNRDRMWSTRKTHLLKNSEWRDALVCQTQTWVALSLSASLLLCPVSWEGVGNLSLESLDSTKHSISKFQLVRCEAGTHVVPDSKGWAPRICPQIYFTHDCSDDAQNSRDVVDYYLKCFIHYLTPLLTD